MPQWDSFSIRDDLRAEYEAPVWVDNDVNLMALAELWRLKRELPNFLVLKVGTGIGCGVVCHGEVYRGANGSAGDVGHICVDPAGPRCHCGNVGCVETMAGGPAIAREATAAAQAGHSPMLAERLAAAGVLTPEDVGNASRAGDAAANQIVQRAGMSDRPDAGVGRQLLQPVARVRRRRAHAHRAAVPRVAAPVRLPALAGAVDAPPRGRLHAAGRPGRADRRGRAGAAGNAARARQGGGWHDAIAATPRQRRLRRRRQGVRRRAGAAWRQLRAGAGPRGRPAGRERRRQEHADEDPRPATSAPTGGRGAHRRRAGALRRPARGRGARHRDDPPGVRAGRGPDASRRTCSSATRRTRGWWLDDAAMRAETARVLQLVGLAPAPGHAGARS